MRDKPLVNGGARFVLQLFDPVFQLQLPPLQLGKFEIVRSGMGEFFLNFPLQSPVQLLEFDKIRLNGHG
jgi:hypothetical protein